MHEDIKRFTQEGKIRDDSYFIRLKDQLCGMIVEIMQDEGYIPHLDINTEFSTWYIEEEKCYGFKLSMYGIEVGVERSCKEMGYSEGRIFKLA